MDSKFYKYCAVPLCHNTTIRTPQKLFVHVPKQKEIRKQWFQLARRDKPLTAQNVYYCEDHFDMPNDMENFMEYHIMGTTSQIRMKPGCLPTKFHCQPDRKRVSVLNKPTTAKRQRKYLIEECLKKEEDSVVLQRNDESSEVPSGSSEVQQPEVQQQPTGDKKINIGVQFNFRSKYRSKYTQTELNLRTKQTSPIKISSTSVSTSPFKIYPLKPNVKAKPSRSNAQKLFKECDGSDSDLSLYTPSLAHSNSSPSLHSLQLPSDCSSYGQDSKQKNEEDARLSLKVIVNKIEKNPLFYIGIPKNCYFLIKFINECTQIPEQRILLCLKKIRLNNTFLELGDDFAITKSYAGRIFMENIPIIANFMRQFLVKLEEFSIKRTLPISFRHNYYNVSCIIDCLEIEIEKPSKAIHQALTWSEYKKANTIKYLISSTPNGLVNYISPGYGGRVSDTCLVETCNFLNCLPCGSTVMADRGFKYIEPLLNQVGCQLVRPPSVESGAKLSKTEVKLTKQIASLRIHIERVIRRLREFGMLKLHSCVNSQLNGRLDNVIVIACGLINLQNSLIRK